MDLDVGAIMDTAAIKLTPMIMYLEGSLAGLLVHMPAAAS
jgi:hypothetical protein